MDTSITCLLVTKMKSEQLKIKIKQDYPPNFNVIKKAFNPPPTVVFTYGDTIYSPLGRNISMDLLAHEATHVKQQGGDPAGWWDKYINDVDFRLKQEVEAYHNQFVEYKKTFKDRNVQTRYLIKLARDLSGAIYGNIVSHSEAMKLIK